MNKEISLIVLMLALVASCSTTAPKESDLRTLSLQMVKDMAHSTNSLEGNDQAIIDSAKDQVSQGLKDPGSAQFRDVRVVNFDNGLVVCGEVNAKNSYGGYVGFKPFVAGTNSASTYENSEYESIERDANAGLMAACQ